MAALQDNTAGPMISMIAEQGVKTICKAVHAITEPNLNDMERSEHSEVFDIFVAAPLRDKMLTTHRVIPLESQECSRRDCIVRCFFGRPGFSR